MNKRITYQEYLKESNALMFEMADQIYQMLLTNAPEHDAEFDELFYLFCQSAAEYAGYRANWLLMSMQEQLEIDETRTRKHNIFIKAKNDLSTYMYENKLNIEWDDILGEERKRIGDFACYLTYIRSINAR